MFCRNCDNRAEIFLHSYRLSLCRKCFNSFFEKRVQKTIEKYKMFSSQEKIMVAVSGGKDSLVLWHVLNKLRYKTKGLHINLGIGEYSNNSEKRVLQFAKNKNLSLEIINIEDNLQVGIRLASKIARQVPCRVCGMVKRYIMNSQSQEFSCLATGHNLDDEVSTLLGNVLNWQEGFLARQAPVLENNKSLKRKVKPLCLSLEQEVAFYAFCNNIEYVKDECPLAKNATSLFYKKVINDIEYRMPATKIRFYKQFIKGKYFSRANGSSREQLSGCLKCGYMTVADICSFCRLKQKINQWKEKHKIKEDYVKRS